MAHDVPELCLRMNDRLEPSVELRDVALFEDLQPPCSVVFWRHADESLARHRNPLFEANVGVTPTRSLTVDTLHCLYLGVINVWCKIAVWALLGSGVYGQVGVERKLRWPPSSHCGHPSWLGIGGAPRRSQRKGVTRVSDLTLNMLGARQDPTCKTKAAEPWAWPCS